MLPVMSGLLVDMRALPMPIVAAWEGPAVGAGAGLALAADLRVCAASARLITGHSRIGSTPDGGMSHLLTRSLGAARAMSLMLRGAALSAAELAAFGLADELVDDGLALDRAIVTARELAQTLAPRAVVGLRALVDSAHGNDLAGQLAHESDWIHQLWHTHDFTEGITAFLERRKPKFQGR
jgi:2-(1,2-epoxy-1,2-dihydrophenyl)acetyl-CoA isomerase